VTCKRGLMEYWLFIAVVLGSIIWYLSNKARVPDVLPLLVAGWVLSYLGGSVDAGLLTIISSVALGLVIFDGFAHMNLKELDTFGWRALKVMLANAVLVFIAVTRCCRVCCWEPFSSE
jgi:Kef-type K+ transport system membrane component KefB